MDPLDEFEFRPLTEGLGFQKKNQERKNKEREVEIKIPLFQRTPSVYFQDSEFENRGKETETPRASLSPPAAVSLPSVSLSSSAVAPSSASSVVFEGSSVGRTPIMTTATTATMTTASTAIMAGMAGIGTSAASRGTSITAKTGAVTGSLAPAQGAVRTTVTYISTTQNLPALFLDGLLILATTLLCFVILILNTRIDLLANLLNPDHLGHVYIATFSVGAAVTFVYVVVNRIFLGFTPGEWVFDLRLGRPEQVGRASYMLMVTMRSILVIGTGYIFFPILSWIFRRDLLGALLGVELLRLKRGKQ